MPVVFRRFRRSSWPRKLEALLHPGALQEVARQLEVPQRDVYPPFFSSKSPVVVVPCW